MKTLILALPLTLCATACVTIPYPKNDPKASGQVVRITQYEHPHFISRKENSQYEMEGFWITDSPTFGGISIYNVRTNAGFGKTVVENIRSQRFNIGDCAVLWEASDVRNPFYPRLSKADANCNAPSVEPPSESSYIYYISHRALHARTLSSWRGASIQALLKQWGNPTSHGNTNNGQYALNYYKNNGVKSIYVNGYLNDRFTLECTDTFYAENNIIVNWAFEGNDCY